MAPSPRRVGRDRTALRRIAPRSRPGAVFWTRLDALKRIKNAQKALKSVQKRTETYQKRIKNVSNALKTHKHIEYTTFLTLRTYKNVQKRTKT